MFRTQQPYVSWKAPATNSVTPTYSQPVTTISNVNNGIPFAARPIKHWRKQLLPNNPSNSGRGRAGVGMPMDTPGGSTYLGDVPNNTTCLLYSATTTSTAARYQENIIKSPSTNFTYNTDDSFYDPVKGQVVCVACTPQSNVIKPATTVMSKRYYTDSKAYLRSRCKLYEQKLSSNPVPGIAYVNAQGQALYPTDAPNGPQVRLTQDCAQNCIQSQQVKTIHKPSNRTFYFQGAVDSGLRTAQMRAQTGQILISTSDKKNWPRV